MDMFLFLHKKIAKRINGWAHRHLSFEGRLTLIKSTLEAIPVHIFQAIEPTGGFLKQIEQQLARFFWGATTERRRTHRISWEQIFLKSSELLTSNYGGGSGNKIHFGLPTFTVSTAPNRLPSLCTPPGLVAQLGEGFQMHGRKRTRI